MKNYTEADYKAAHKFCIRNSEKLKNDNVCGCFYCLSIFHPSEIKKWLKEKRPIETLNFSNNNLIVKEWEYMEEQTALCPFCNIDSLIGESSGYPITKDFLIKMKEYWFN